jgi:hypothetical protein
MDCRPPGAAGGLGDHPLDAAAWRVNRRPRLFYSPNAGALCRPNWRLCRSRFAAVFHHVGSGAGSRLFAGLHLGWAKSALRGHQVFDVHRHFLHLHSGGGAGYGLLWRLGHL